MFRQLLTGWNRSRRTAPLQKTRRCRLAVEQLEDRLVPTTVPAIIGLQNQTLANPTSTSTSQALVAGVWQNIVNQSVTITPNQTGVVDLKFEAQAFSGMANRLGVRYLIDGNVDPNDAMVNLSSTTADTVDDIGPNSWQTLFLAQQLRLSTGTHVITVQMFCMNATFLGSQLTTVYTPVLQLTAYNVIDNQAAALSVQAQPVSLGTGTPGQKLVTAGSWQTLVSQPIVIGSGMSGLVDLNFEATAFSSVTNRVLLRYIVDGKLDPNDMTVTLSPFGADAVNDMILGVGGNWRTLFLSRQLNLAPGAHTIAVQVEFTNQGILGADPIVYTPTLGLTGYTNIDKQISGGGLQTQVPSTPDSGSSGTQSVAVGTWTTVASLPLTIGARSSGLADLTFQAQASTDVANRVFVRYLIDGHIDPTDQATTLSASTADTTVDFLDQAGPVWETLSLTHLVSLSAGSHTVSVQVFVLNPGQTAGHDLTVVAPNLHMTGYAVVTPSPYFNYDGSTHTLTVTGTSGNDTFRFSQVTTSAANGVLTSVYTFTVNGSSVSYTSSQVTSVVVNGGGGTDSATLVTNDTYVGADQKTHETVEQILMNAGSTVLQKMDSHNNSTPFLTLTGFANVTATMGHADSAQMYDGAGANTFTTSGLTSTMTGSGYSNTVSGARTVIGHADNGTGDKAYHYDGSGPSTFISSGTAYSLMQGTDNGLSFYNLAVGFTTNYGIARHKSQDIAIFYDSPGTDVFVGTTGYSYMYSDDASGNFAMFNAAQGFGKVYAYSFVGGIDYYYNYDPSVNFVVGFQTYKG